MKRLTLFVVLLLTIIFSLSASAQVDIEPGGEHEFSYSTYTSFMPSSGSVTYQGEGSTYFSQRGYAWLSSFLIGNEYLSGLRFTYQCALNTPAGDYNGTFTIVFKKNSQSKTLTKNVTFHVSGGSTAPTANFTGSPTSGTAPLTVQFTDQSTGEITSRSWTFGDGATSSLKNPSHTYQNSGAYTVRLTVNGPGGSNTKTRTNYISVSGQSTPVANFSASPRSGTAPLTVQFTNLSTGNITSRLWNFGNGHSSSATSPSHTYQNSGTYSVKLTVNGPDGSNTKTRTNYIMVGSQNNLLLNGDFSQNAEYWGTYVHGTGNADMFTQNGECVVKITNGGLLVWYVQLYQNIIPIIYGATYQVSFDAYSENHRTIFAYVGKNADPWSFYSDYEGFSLTTQKQTFTYSFTMNSSTDQAAHIVFDVGYSNSDVYFDNISLYQLSNTGLATKPDESLLDKEIILLDNYPNPFNSNTEITFKLPTQKNISLKIFDVNGKLVKTLIGNQNFSEGFHRINWDGTNNNKEAVTSGVYVYRLEYGKFCTSKKLTFVK